jgi:hypothetical protein
MRSRQTGQVGSSRSEGVGGGGALVVSWEMIGEVDGSAERWVGECEGEKGSLVISGKTPGR